MFELAHATNDNFALERLTWDTLNGVLKGRYASKCPESTSNEVKGTGVTCTKSTFRSTNRRPSTLGIDGERPLQPTLNTDSASVGKDKAYHRISHKLNLKLKYVFQLSTAFKRARVALPTYEHCCKTELGRYYFLKYLEKNDLKKFFEYVMLFEGSLKFDAKLEQEMLTGSRLEELLCHPSLRKDFDLIIPSNSSEDRAVKVYIRAKMVVQSSYMKFRKSREYEMFIKLSEYVTTRRYREEDFERIGMLGTGAFGRVTAVVKADTRTIYAMKEIPKWSLTEDLLLELVENEKEILSKVSSPFVLRLKYSFQSKTALNLVFEMCSGGNLYQYIKQNKFSVDTARFYAAEILLGLDHIHKHGWVYRDLKPTNVLLTETGHCKISDLGLAIKLPELPKLLQHAAGTPGYWAPEICAKTGTYLCSDYWSFGVLLYVMLTGTNIRDPLQRHRISQPNTQRWSPFAMIMTDRLVARKDPTFRHMDASFRFPEGTDNQGKDLISKLLVKDLQKRLGGLDSKGLQNRGMKEIMTHPFFAKTDW
eukprot:CAMPEP_0184487848 /NCGR_PEP_ID=MMETSP0113_2-20130426/10369_1 /TAXON_ID=91329 /ORGANISM="Norrisiella sphaerica, Strain BC52" /LENGTH=534 /DNA_ID=CAMNT_0026870263 /DNA_START=190 /DNA_END=1791 /DNA_ORIENTATION=+